MANTTYIVRVRDNYAPKGHYIDEMDVATKDEAKAWVKAFRKLHTKDDGYTVTLTEETI